MARTPSDFNSRGPKSGPKTGSGSRSPSGAKPSGAKFGGSKSFGRDNERAEAPRSAKPAPRRDTMPVFDAEPERPSRAAKPADKPFGGKTFGAKSFSAKTFGAKPAQGRGFAEPGDFEKPARGRPAGAKPFGAKPAAGRSAEPGDFDKPRGRPAGAKPYGKPAAGRARPARDEGTSPVSMPVKDGLAPERIAKAMSRGGVASRRDAEKMILEGRVTVNGKVIDSPALTVTAKDKVTIDGHVLAAPEPPRLWLYHKPEGLVTTARDELGRPTVFEDLPEDMPRVMSVGRLDLTSEGLLLLTNDGEVKRKLELPSTGWLRKYRVRVNGRPMDPDFEPLRQGITIEGEVFAPMIVALDRQQGANAWLTVAIREGRNREIRRAMEAVGYRVNRLIRVSYGPFQLGDLKPGEVAEVRPKLLRDQLGLTETPEDDGFRAPERGTRTISRTVSRGKPGSEPTNRGPASKAGASKFGAAKTGGRFARDEAPGTERSPYAPRSGTAERGERPNYSKPRSTDAEAPRGFGNPDRATGPRSFGSDRPERSTGGKSFGNDRPERGTGGKSFGGDRPERGTGGKSFGSDRPERGTGGKSFGYGNASAASKPALARGGARATELDAPKPAWARGPASGKPAGGRPSGGKPQGGKPAGGKPFGGKPSGGARKR